MAPAIAGRMVCHVLVGESADGLVLVDSGLGMADAAQPSRVGPVRHLVGPRFDPAETAVRQLAERGYRPGDVRHIVITHFDFDHVGGISDFPNATVHTTAAEYQAANHPPSRTERQRYRKVQWAHGPIVRTYGGDGESWRGFPLAHPIPGLGDEVALIPMPGHTRGHAAVAVQADERGWLVHAGDAAFVAVGDGPAGTRPGTRRARGAVLAFEQVAAQDRRKIAANHRRLAELDRRSDVTVIPAHDAATFDASPTW